MIWRSFRLYDNLHLCILLPMLHLFLEINNRNHFITVNLLTFGLRGCEEWGKTRVAVRTDEKLKAGIILQRWHVFKFIIYLPAKESAHLWSCWGSKQFKQDLQKADLRSHLQGEWCNFSKVLRSSTALCWSLLCNFYSLITKPCR